MRLLWEQEVRGSNPRTPTKSNGEYCMAYNPPMPQVADPEKMDKLRRALADAGLQYMVIKVEGTIAHVNVWVGEQD